MSNLTDWSCIKELFNDSNRTDEIAEKFAVQLEKDLGSDIVSECVLYTPRLKSALNKRTGAANRVAYFLQEYTTHTSESFKNYTQIIKKLVLKYKEQRKSQNEAAILEKTRKKFWKKGINYDSPVCQRVKDPVAMPIDISDEKDLKPFYDFLKNKFKDKDEDKVLLEFKRGSFFIHDRRMDLCKQGIGEANIKDLMDALKTNDNVDHFLLGNNIIGNYGASLIQDYLLTTEKDKIKTWYLAGNNFDSNSIQLLCDGLKFGQSTQLWLKRNPIKPEGSIYIADLLFNSNIEVLDVSFCGLMDEGAGSIFKVINKSKHLKHLYIDGNGLTVSSIRIISEQLSCLECKLETLYITTNNLRDEGCMVLAEALSENASLNRLNVSSNGISTIGLNILFQNSLNLSFLGAGRWKAEEDLGALPNTLDSYDSLLHLIEKGKLKMLAIDGLNLSDQVLWKIAARLQHNHTLCHIDYDRRSKRPNDLKLEIQRILDRNNPYSKRSLKHGDYIYDIDSIYRNRM